MKKISIIGSGFVGASIAYALVLQHIGHEIVLIDNGSGKAESEVMDIRHGLVNIGMTKIVAGGFADCADSDLIIIAAGRNRRPDESRLDLLKDNRQIIRDVNREVAKYYRQGIVVVVTNPVDVFTYQTAQQLQLPLGKVIGTGCLLDSSRLVSRIAEYTSLSKDIIEAFVVGEHGDTQTPMWSKATVAGMSIADYCQMVGLPWDHEQRKAIENDIRNMGTRIIEGKGRTHYGIATCVCSVARAILEDQATVLSLSVPLQGEYGLSEVALSLPVVLGGGGVKHVLCQLKGMEVECFVAAGKKLQGILKSLE